MKLFFRIYLNLLVIIVAFALCNGYGALRPFAMSGDVGTQLVLAVVLTVLLFIAAFVSVSYFRNYTTVLVLSGGAAALGTLMSLMAYMLMETRHCHISFGEGVLITLVATPVFAVLSAAFTASVKNIFVGILRGDFITVLISLLVGYSAGMLAVCFVALTVQLSIAITICMFLGLMGGVSGSKAQVVDSKDYIVSDSNGNLHFVQDTVSKNRIVDTDGETLRRNADNTWDKL